VVDFAELAAIEVLFALEAVLVVPDLAALPEFVFASLPPQAVKAVIVTAARANKLNNLFFIFHPP